MAEIRQGNYSRSRLRKIVFNYKLLFTKLHRFFVMGRPSAKIERDPFGERILKLRIEAGLTQRALAAAMGVHQTRLSQIEVKGLQNLEIVAALAKGLNMSTDELFGLETAKRHRRGPKGELECLLEDLSRLTRHKQKAAIDFLRAWIKDAQTKH